MQKDLVNTIKDDKPRFWEREQFEGYRIFMLCEALEQEAKELKMETKWKWWKAEENYKIDYENRKVEIADLWHFLIQLTQEVGMTAQDVTEAYYKKWSANIIRQEDRY